MNQAIWLASDVGAWRLLAVPVVGRGPSARRRQDLYIY